MNAQSSDQVMLFLCVTREKSTVARGSVGGEKKASLWARGS